eukprot:5184683-Prymnesium_polylepis.1
MGRLCSFCRSRDRWTLCGNYVDHHEVISSPARDRVTVSGVSREIAAFSRFPGFGLRSPALSS